MDCLVVVVVFVWVMVVVNGVIDWVMVMYDDVVLGVVDVSVDVVLLNLFFYFGFSVYIGVVICLFEVVVWVFCFGGELFIVYNLSFGYCVQFECLIGLIVQLYCILKFIVMCSICCFGLIDF